MDLIQVLAENQLVDQFAVGSSGLTLPARSASLTFPSQLAAQSR
jgi:hypothetical protein